MDNMAVYKKTFGFSLRRLGWDALSILILGCLCVLGFLIVDKTSGNGLIGLVIGLVVPVFIMRRFPTSIRRDRSPCWTANPRNSRNYTQKRYNAWGGADPFILSHCKDSFCLHLHV